MRSLIIIEVEHGDSTDDLEAYIAYVSNIQKADAPLKLLDYTVKVDLPACFTLGD